MLQSMLGASPMQATSASSSSGHGPSKRSSQMQPHWLTLPRPQREGSSPTAPHNRWQDWRGMQLEVRLGSPPAAPAPGAPLSPAMVVPPSPEPTAPALPPVAGRSSELHATPRASAAPSARGRRSHSLSNFERLWAALRSVKSQLRSERVTLSDGACVSLSNGRHKLPESGLKSGLQAPPQQPY
jgi:hypothetical protein